MNLRMRAKRSRTLVYLHIPKCGGTTLNSILKANFPDDRRFYVDATDISGSRRELASLPEEKRRSIHLLHGHLSYGWHQLLPNKALYFTVIRHPLQRCVSHYNYVRFRTAHPHYLRDVVEREKMTLSDYVRSGVCDEMNNGQVRLLAGVEDIVQEPHGRSALEYGSNDPALLEQALHNIRRDFVVVGLQERYEESLLLLRHRLGLRRIASPRKNVARFHYDKHTATPTEVEVIEDYNQLDLALYCAMAEQFEDELGAIGCQDLQLCWLRLRTAINTQLSAIRHQSATVLADRGACG